MLGDRFLVDPHHFSALRKLAVFAVSSIALAGCESRDSMATDASVDTACELHVVWDPYEPYSYSDGGRLPVGYDIDVARAVAEIVGCQLTFEEMAWSDVLIALESGQADVAVGTGYKSDRAAWSWYSDSYRDEVIGLMVRTASVEQFAGENLADVLRSGLSFGKTIDDTYDNETEALFSEFREQVKPRVSESENLRRLLDREIDGFLVEINVGAALAVRLDATDAVEFHPVAFDAGSYRLQLSKATVSSAQLAKINAAIQSLQHSGWLENTLAVYGLPSATEKR